MAVPGQRHAPLDAHPRPDGRHHVVDGLPAGEVGVEVVDGGSRAGTGGQ